MGYIVFGKVTFFIGIIGISTTIAIFFVENICIFVDFDFICSRYHGGFPDDKVMPSVMPE